MDRRDDARTVELNNLRLALAAFALQLAAFEMRLQLTPSTSERLDERSGPAPSLDSLLRRRISIPDLGRKG